MMNSNVPEQNVSNVSHNVARKWYIPLQVVRPRVFVLAVRAERTDIAGAVMYKPVPDHLVLPLETLPSLSACTAWNRAIVRSCGRMDVRMGATIR